MNVIFTPRDFKTFRNFSDRMAKEFGQNTYVGTDYATVLVEYSPELKAMIRPLPEREHFNFDLKKLQCDDCRKVRLLICLPEQTSYLCEECALIRKKNVRN